MLIGVDFDNTIVSYDALFHRIALEQGLVPPDVPASKVSVRDHLRRIDKEDLWTEMQGYVYGARMDEAAMYPGVLDFLRWARQKSIVTVIVSHKTQHPFLGPKYDLHGAARAWIAHHLRDEDGALVEATGVFFELTKEAKLARIAALGCSHFIDDLPEILLADGFPERTEPILFDPENHHAGVPDLVRVRQWKDLKGYFEGAWAAIR